MRPPWMEPDAPDGDPTDEDFARMANAVPATERAATVERERADEAQAWRTGWATR